MLADLFVRILRRTVCVCVLARACVSFSHHFCSPAIPLRGWSVCTCNHVCATRLLKHARTHARVRARAHTHTHAPARPLLPLTNLLVHGIAAQVIGLIHISIQITQALHGLNVPTVQEGGGGGGV